MSQGYIYFIEIPGRDLIKIGYSENPSKRLGALQTSHPEKLVLLAAIPGSLKDERRQHERFVHLHVRGEWFRATDDLREHICVSVTLSAKDIQKKKLAILNSVKRRQNRVKTAPERTGRTVRELERDWDKAIATGSVQSESGCGFHRHELADAFRVYHAMKEIRSGRTTEEFAAMFDLAPEHAVPYVKVAKQLFDEGQKPDEYFALCRS